MKKKLLVASFLLLSQIAFAGDLLTVNQDEAVSGGYSVPKVATLKASSGDIELTRVGYGTRTKTEGWVFKIDVYRASLLTSNPQAFKHTSVGDAALDSILDMSAAAIRLDFLWTVSADKIHTAFVDALKVNHVDTESSSIQQFKNAVIQGGDAKSGKSITIAMEMSADKKSGIVLYENTEGQIAKIAGDAKFIREIFSIWLGAPVPGDTGLENLKKSLIGE